MATITAVEARVELKRLYEHAEEIDKKYPDGKITSTVDEEELKTTLGNIDLLEAQLTTLEDAERRRERIALGKQKYADPRSGPADQYVRDLIAGRTHSPGVQFTNDPQYKQLMATGAFNSPLKRLEFAVDMKNGTSLVEWYRRAAYENKALLYGSSTGSGGALTVNDRQPGIVDILQREITFLDVVPRLQTDSDVVEYVLENTFTNNAAFTAEASATTGTSGTKPESVLAYVTATQNVQNLAHWIPITNRLLADAPAIRGIIDGRLLFGLTLTLESQVLVGDGTGSNFTGILNTANVLTQAVQANENRLDAVLRARTQVRVTGHGRPNVVIMHPNDFLDVRLIREGVATGAYLMGPPSQLGATTLWGLPVIESEAITQNTALVADMVNGCALFDREQASVRVGLINDQFTRNMQTILAELRAAFVVWRPTCFCQVTGI